MGAENPNDPESPNFILDQGQVDAMQGIGARLIRTYWQNYYEYVDEALEAGEEPSPDRRYLKGLVNGTGAAISALGIFCKDHWAGDFDLDKFFGPLDWEVIRREVFNARRAARTAPVEPEKPSYLVGDDEPGTSPFPPFMGLTSPGPTE